MAKAPPVKATIAIENLEPRMSVYNLAHAAHRLTLKSPQVQELRGGKQIGVMVTKRLPDSITFLARERKFGLAPTVLQCPEIDAAVKARPPRLKVLHGPIVDRSQRSGPPPKRPSTKPSRKKLAGAEATLTGTAKR